MHLHTQPQIHVQNEDVFRWCPVFHRVIKCYEHEALMVRGEISPDASTPHSVDQKKKR